MSWDIKYRPRSYEDVLGQEITKVLFRQYVSTGKGFHQSYLIHGPYGDGKTTLGRILARALLCDAPIDGCPCDSCSTCRELLETGKTECFTEVDAATNSGKDGIKKILETIQYSSFSGKRRIYLLDESHQLSKDALDALLKPMEDARASGERRLVCIFCTTEPEKMRATVGSRCGPSFSIEIMPPEKIAQRLAWVCDQEGATYDMAALVQIAEGTECHIRDSLRACEMLAGLSRITVEAVHRYLGVDLNSSYLSVLEALGTEDIAQGIQAADGLLKRVSPAKVYENLAKVSLLAYKVSLGISNPASYWDTNRLRGLGQKRGESLLGVSELFSTRPRRPTLHMLQCDLLSIHQRILRGTTVGQEVDRTFLSVAPGALSQPHLDTASQAQRTSQPSTSGTPLPSTKNGGKNYLTPGGVYVPPFGVSRNRREVLEGSSSNKGEPLVHLSEMDLSPDSFSLLARLRAQELSAGELSETEFSTLLKRVLSDYTALSRVTQLDVEDRRQHR